MSKLIGPPQSRDRIYAVPFAQTHCFDRALAYLEGHKVKVDEIVTREFALEEYSHALETLRSREGTKIIIRQF